MTDESILVVDDDRDLLESLRAILDAEGYEVDVAETGADAFGKLGLHSYSLLLLDVFLPDMSGLEILTRVRKMAPNTVNIMLSGNPGIDSAIQALNRGADYFLLKPVQPEKLISVVKETLKERRGDSSIEKNEVTVIVPVLNEEEAIGQVLEELKAEGYENILVVDGYSTDNTTEIAREAGATILMQHGNGKMGALKTAFDHIKTPYLLVMDGDYTYSARDVERFLPFAKRFDQILGSRKEGRHNISRLHRVGNWVINTAVNTLIGSGVSDVCTGMYMMKTDVARNLEMKTGGFNAEVEAAIQNLTNGEVTEVPINYRKRLGRRKLSTWRQGFQILWSVLRLSFSYNPIFFLTALGSLFTVPGVGVLLHQFHLRLVFGETGWSIGYVWLGLILLLAGLNSFTIATFTLISKRQERRIIQQIKDLPK